MGKSLREITQGKSTLFVNMPGAPLAKPRRNRPNPRKRRARKRKLELQLAGLLNTGDHTDTPPAPSGTNTLVLESPLPTGDPQLAPSPNPGRPVSVLRSLLAEREPEACVSPIADDDLPVEDLYTGVSPSAIEEPSYSPNRPEECVEGAHSTQRSSTLSGKRCYCQEGFNEENPMLCNGCASIFALHMSILLITLGLAKRSLSSY